MAKAKKYWNIILNKESKKAEILIYEQIGAGFWEDGIGAKDFAKELKDLGDLNDLDIRINSPGGSVFEGLTIYNLLKGHKAQKTVYIDGLAASIASVIAMAGDLIVMPENATMMIHDPWSMAIGTAEDMRKEADVLDKIKVGILSAYRDKTGKSDEDLSALMAAETWMTGPEAAEMGFCDECTKPQKAAAMTFDLSKFKNVPKTLCPQASAPAAPAAPKATTTTFKEAKPMAKVPCSKCGSPMTEGGDCPACEAKLQTQAAVKQAREAETLRANAVRAAAREYRMPELGEVAVAEGWTEEQTKDAILKKIKANGDPSKPLNISVSPAHEGKPFRSLGEQLIAVANTARGHMDQRLKEVYNAASGASEAVPADGGFLVQSDFSTALLDLAHDTAILMPKCREIPVSGNGIDAPIVDETSRATGSRFGGVQIYRVNEGDAGTPKKPKLARWAMKLEKIIGLFYATDELLEDAVALENIATQAFAEEFGFVGDDEIVRGDGAGKMLGLLNSPALVSISKETGQIAKTVVAENVMKMFERMPARLIPGAEWYINQELWSQLFQMQLTLGTGGVPLFMPPAGLAAAPYGTLMGRPIVPIEQASALGTQGDIIFANLKQFGIITKGGLNGAQSIHVKFTTDEMTFRWTTRNNGQPIWKSSVTPYKANSGFVVSPYITLATRA